ncbi:MAG: hypothetical protein ACFE0P_03265 [Oceanicaulis sp.]
MAVICLERRLIFIKTSKTAGTSIEVELSRRLGPNAVVTPIFPAEPGHQPRNHLGANGEARFYNHMTAAEVRALIGEDAFRPCFKFAVEREPVDKCLSHFHMLKNRDDAHALPEAERSALTWASYVAQGRFPVDAAKYRDPDAPDRLLVDRVIAYETLASDLPALLAQAGIANFRLEARAKGDYRREAVLGREEVTAEQRARIYAAFSETITLTRLYRRVTELRRGLA